MADTPGGGVEGRPPHPGAPRWLKVTAITLAVLIFIAVVVVKVTGGGEGHGPGRHSAPTPAGVASRW